MPVVTEAVVVETQGDADMVDVTARVQAVVGRHGYRQLSGEREGRS